jgi:tetratricopeptide (TPR) repeat protein
LFLSCGQSPKDLVLAGDEKAKAHDYEGALADYSAAIAARPELYQAWHHRGECRMQLGQYEPASGDFLESLKLKPDFSLSRYDLGLCYLKLKKYHEALQELEKACRADTAIHGALALANSNYYCGNNQAAIRYYTEALSDLPDSSGIYLGRGLAYYQSGNFAASKSDLSTYLLKGGTNPVAYRQLGLLYLRKGSVQDHVDSSVIYLDLYKAKNPVADVETGKALTLSYLVRAKILIAEGREILAMADLSKAIELDPANAEALYQRGKIMVALGQTAEGCIDLQSALKNGNSDAKKLIAIYCKDVL